MSFHKPPSKWDANQVNWSDPELKALLDRSENWTLDNRSGFEAQRVDVHIGWGASGGRPALLVWERGQAMVLETQFPIAKDEKLRIDRVTATGLRSVWGVVADGRKGTRADDEENNIYVHWVHTQ
ncbi:hypothetical protein [Dyella sp. 2RAB6]|uniref:hypothetical protein n=1 Tax=Dyella sp. 2RAB6 TaxID=3232992 RepID=UPI003F8EDA48